MEPEKAQRGVVLVTGSSGLIGNAVTSRLVAQYNVIGFDREGPPHPPPSAECICIDLTSEESVGQALQGVRERHGERITSVIHLAAFYDFSGEPSPKYEEITVQGTERLLRNLRSFRVEQFVFSSTMLVHAPAELGQRINEEWPLDPKWPYPESKVKTERLIRAQHGRIPAVLLRIAGVYDDRCHSLPLAHQIQRIYERHLTSRVFPGGTSHGQAFLHLDDLVDALVRVVERRAALRPETVLLLGEAETVSYDELQHTFSRLIHGESWETRQIPKPLAKAGAWVQDTVPIGEEPFIKPWMIELADQHYALDIARARTLLGWEPKRSLRDTLPKMVAALKADPLRWYRENKLEPPPGLEEAPNHEGRGVPGGEASQGHSMQDPMVMMAKEHYAPYRWVQAAISGLAIWLIASPFTLGYASRALTWSDVLSGAVALGMSLYALKPQRGLVSWLISIVGLWLLFAPLVFWAPDAAAYANDTLVGGLLIAFGLIIPMGMEMEGPAIPPGWSYNPSAWSQRAPMIALAFVSFLAARYMAAFQLGHISDAWDPFFGDGTERVLTSEVSRAWPVSDAGLGAMTYLLEVLMGLMGDQRRWRTMPWMVAGFGIIVVPLGVVSIVLVIMQPLAVGAWCSLCLFTAAAMLFMIPLALDEVVAMIQLVVRKKREGRSAWRVFWLGANLPDDTPTWQPTRPESWRPSGMLWGITSSWSLWLSAAIGVWLMFAPAAFGISIQQAAADSDHLVGALIIVVAIISLAEVARPARFLNVLLGLWLIAAPWFLSSATSASRWNSALMGLAVVLLSLPLGKLRDHYGTFDHSVLWSPRARARERHRQRQWGPRAQAPAMH